LAPSQPLAAALEEPAADPEAERTADTLDGPSVLGSTLVLRGELRLAEDLIIEGCFDGSITQGDHRLSIGEQARVRATVRTGSAVIAGFVDGDVRGSHVVVVKKTATLRGALSAERLSLDFRANLEDVVLSGKVARASGR
jgi:cytoskeletal protein CcmA (bactofilin family)